MFSVNHQLKITCVNPSQGGGFYVFIPTLSIFGVRAWFFVKEIRILFCLRFLSVECMNKRIFYIDMKLITCIALLSKENKKGSCIHQASLRAHNISPVIKSQCFLNYRKMFIYYYVQLLQWYLIKLH